MAISKSLSTCTLALAATLTFAPLKISGAEQAATGRTMFTTLIKGRAEKSIPGKGAESSVHRISISLKNISGIPQTVRITLTDLYMQNEIQYESEAVAAVENTSWDLNLLYKDWRMKGKEIPNITEQFDIPAYGAYDYVMSIKCDFTNAFNCHLGEPHVTPNGKATAINLVTRVAAKIDVLQDRGAILADFNSQVIVAGKDGWISTKDARPVNGGRPF